MKEEGPKEMTLDEWKAVQDKERAKMEFNIRKANDGANWNKGFVLHKSKAEVSHRSHFQYFRISHSVVLLSLSDYDRLCRH